MGANNKNKIHVGFLVSFLIILIFCFLTACNLLEIEEEIPPTATEIVAARASANSQTQQNYDFFINLQASVNLPYVSSQSVNANYNAQYRHNTQTDNLKFKRQTSGALLYDSTVYIETTGTAKTKIYVNEDGNIKKASTYYAAEEDGLYLLNIPFVAIVNALKEANIEKIQINKDESSYKYKAQIHLASEKQSINAILSSLGKMGTTLKISNATVDNVANGIDFNFNLKNNMLTDFEFQLAISFPIKGVATKINLLYRQSANDTNIIIPTVSNLINKPDEIQTEIQSINSKISDIQNSPTFSLDFEAVNQFDPGWNITATVDKYIARLYKNTILDNEGNPPRVDFNHSFKYTGEKKHTFTIGNIANGDIYEISRTGANTQTKLDNYNINTQFGLLTSSALIPVSSVDCIKKETKKGFLVYSIFMNSTQATQVQANILNIVNSYDIDGKHPVINYFDDENYRINDAEMLVYFDGNKSITKIEVSTKIKYYPIDGEHVDKNITLTNSITINFNSNLDKAQKYIAPDSVNTALAKIGLNNFAFFIA